NGPAYHGQQWLDLDGASAGSIFQTFATTPGTQYVLSFAYANNPYYTRPTPPPPSWEATVSVTDSVSGADLITPLLISHDTATPDDYPWALSGPIHFTAQGLTATLSFVSDDPPTSDTGIFLDAISVTAVPEPSSMVMALIGIPLLAARAVRRRWRAAAASSTR